MEELYQESLQRLKELPPRINTKMWNKIAKEEKLLSSESLKYISGTGFRSLCKKIHKES